MIMTHPCDLLTFDCTSFQRETHSMWVAIFGTWYGGNFLEACSSSGGWLSVQTWVFLSPLQVRKGLFLAAVHSIHAALPGFWHTGPVYVWFTCICCKIQAALPHLPGTCHFSSAVTFIGKSVFTRHLFPVPLWDNTIQYKNIGPHCVLLIAMWWQRNGAAEASAKG